MSGAPRGREEEKEVQVVPIRLSGLPPELQRQILEQAGEAPTRKAPQRARAVVLKSTLMQRCACGFEIFRPDGNYPKTCDGCGRRWPTTK